MLNNWSYIHGNLTEWALSGYITTVGLGAWFWAIIFSAVIGYVYLKQQSFTAAAVAALILIAAFGNSLLGLELWVSLMHILVALTFTALLLIFLTKLRR